MVKKKYFLFSSIFLLLLLLGSYSTSYALTETEYKNVCYNYLVNKLSYTSETAKSKVDSYDLTNIRPYFENSAYGFFIFTQSNTSQELYLTIVKRDGYTSNDTNSIWCGSTGTSWSVGRNVRYKYNKINTNGNYDSTLTDMWSFSFGVNNFGTELDIWGVQGLYDSTRKKWYPAGTWSSVLSKEGPFLDDHFDFTYDSNISFASLHDSQGYFGEVALVPKGTTSIKLGELEQAQFIDYIIKQKMKYNKYTGFFDTYSAETITSWTDSDDVYNVFVNGNDIANIFVLYTAYSNDSDFLPLNYSYFITDNMTIISGDSIELALTFDDDNYYNNYNNTIQNEQDEQSAQDRTDDIINSITGFNSGDAESFVNFGEMPELDDPTSNLLSYLLSRISYCFTEDFSSSYIDVPFLSTTTRVYASQFDFLPTQLKTIIAAFAILALIRRYFPKIHGLVTAVSTANIGSFAEKIQGGLSVIDIL